MTACNEDETLNASNSNILDSDINTILICLHCGSGLVEQVLLGSLPPVEVSLMGGTGGCMLGGSEDDRCRPTRSKVPGFQLLDAED